MALSNPSSSVMYLHFSGPPAIPITVQPFILAICPTTEPTAPAPPETKTTSPSLISPTSKIPK